MAPPGEGARQSNDAALLRTGKENPACLRVGEAAGQSSRRQALGRAFFVRRTAARFMRNNRQPEGWFAVLLIVRSRYAAKKSQSSGAKPRYRRPTPLPVIPVAFLQSLGARMGYVPRATRCAAQAGHPPGRLWRWSRLFVSGLSERSGAFAGAITGAAGARAGCVPHWSDIPKRPTSTPLQASRRARGSLCCSRQLPSRCR